VYVDEVYMALHPMGRDATAWLASMPRFWPGWDTAVDNTTEKPDAGAVQYPIRITIHQTVSITMEPLTGMRYLRSDPYQELCCQI